MSNEISQAKKEVNFYIENVEKNKIITATEKRKIRKQKLTGNQSELSEVNSACNYLLLLVSV